MTKVEKSYFMQMSSDVATTNRSEDKHVIYVLWDIVGTAFWVSLVHALIIIHFVHEITKFTMENKMSVRHISVHKTFIYDYLLKTYACMQYLALPTTVRHSHKNSPIDKKPKVFNENN